MVRIIEKTRSRTKLMDKRRIWIDMLEQPAPRSMLLCVLRSVIHHGWWWLLWGGGQAWSNYNALQLVRRECFYNVKIVFLHFYSIIIHTTTQYFLFFFLWLLLSKLLRLWVYKREWKIIEWIYVNAVFLPYKIIYTYNQLFNRERVTYTQFVKSSCCLLYN